MKAAAEAFGMVLWICISPVLLACALVGMVAAFLWGELRRGFAFGARLDNGTE